MQFSLEKDVFHYAIHSYTEEGIWVSVPWTEKMTESDAEKTETELHSRSFIIAPDQLIAWERERVQSLNTEDIAQWCQLEPEIIILGTGKTHEWPDMEVLAPLYAKNIGIEIMSTDAACRTYNLLMTDQRKVIAAMLIQC